MKHIKDVHGSAEMAVPIYVGKTRVDIHTNIRKDTTPDPMTGEIPENMYIYDETQYSMQEYIDYMTQKQTEIEDALCEIDAG